MLGKLSVLIASNRIAQRVLRPINSPSRAFFLALAVLLVSLTGCIVGPDFTHLESPALPQSYLTNPDVDIQHTVAISDWWDVFADEKLNELIGLAQGQNLTLIESYERIIEARASLRLQGGQLTPNTSLVGEYAFSKRSVNGRPFITESSQNGDPFDLFNLGADSIWEIDLFGKIRRSIEAADAEVQFQENEFAHIRQTLFADIAASYLRIRLLQGQVELINESIAVQDVTAEFVSERGEAGVSNELDSQQTESFRHRSGALLASLQQELDLEFNQLAILIGQAPDIGLREFVGVQPLPTLPPMPEAGIPADVLRRRPDIQRDEMAVRAASARIGIAEADLYPQLSLIGSVSVSSRTVSSLFETDGLAFAVGPSLQWNILQFRQINSNIEINKSRFRQSIAKYRATVLAAVREVEDGLIRHDGFYKQWKELNLAIEADEKAVALSLNRYKIGKTNFQRVLDAQQQLLDDRQQMVLAQAEATTQLIRIYKAAGGNWSNIGSATCVNHATCADGTCNQSQLIQSQQTRYNPSVNSSYSLPDQTWSTQSNGRQANLDNRYPGIQFTPQSQAISSGPSNSEIFVELPHLDSSFKSEDTSSAIMDLKAESQSWPSSIER